MRHGGKVLIEQLEAEGVDTIFCVPGESYLAALDALHDSNRIRTVICRQEGGAAMMADAHARMTGRVGVCFVTRGPGATNASIGVHIAQQDSIPMVLFVGLPGRDVEDREAFQEFDLRAVFGSLAKGAEVVSDAARLPERHTSRLPTASYLGPRASGGGALDLFPLRIRRIDARGLLGGQGLRIQVVHRLIRLQPPHRFGHGLLRRRESSHRHEAGENAVLFRRQGDRHGR